MKTWLLFLLLAFLGPLAATAQSTDEAPFNDPLALPAVQHFLGESGFGAPHPEAPAETNQFGQLAGIWITQQELRQMDGSWRAETPGLWIWKYTLGGFAVQDLWYQHADNLPQYMSTLGRDYMLTALRIFDARQQRWQIAWMANGAGKSPGQDFGTFTATFEEDRLVMTSPPDAFGIQRVTFSSFTEDSFRWKSEFSRDEGQTWQAVMRVHARRWTE